MAPQWRQRIASVTADRAIDTASSTIAAVWAPAPFPDGLSPSIAWLG
jgi:hypothetical protein